MITGNVATQARLRRSISLVGSPVLLSVSMPCCPPGKSRTRASSATGSVDTSPSRTSTRTSRFGSRAMSSTARESRLHRIGSYRQGISGKQRRRVVRTSTSAHRGRAPTGGGPLQDSGMLSDDTGTQRCHGGDLDGVEAVGAAVGDHEG